MGIPAEISDLVGFPLWLRWKMYRGGFLKQKRLPHPVISVGSVLLGGAGKTPMTIYIAEKLLDMGNRPAILTRGYGRRDGFSRVLVRNGNSDWQSCGDEPLLISSKLPNVPVVVHRDRYGSGIEVANEVNCYILDDGFQHIELRRELDIVLLSGYENRSMLLPFGSRRDGLWRLRKIGEENAAIAVLPEDSQGDALCKILPKNTKTIRYKTRAGDIYPLSNPGERILPQELAGRKVLLAAGIARPGRFLELVNSLDADVVGHIFFRDHRFFLPAQVRLVEREARRRGAEIILTTEKDAVKIQKFATQGFYAISIELVLSPEGIILDELGRLFSRWA